MRRQFEALSRGGVDAASEHWHPDIEWRAVEGAADDTGPLEGRDALRRYYEDWLETFSELRAEVTDVIFDNGERVAVVVQNSGRGRASGVETKGSYHVACTVRDGRIAKGREYATREEALRAAQASEAVSPDNVAVMRRFSELWFRERDLQAALQLFHPDAEMDWSNSRAPYSGLYRGRTEIEAAGKLWLDAWEEFVPEIKEAIEVDAETVLFVTQVSARGRSSGVPVQADGASVWKLREGKIVHGKLFQSKHEALEALGLGG